MGMATRSVYNINNQKIISIQVFSNLNGYREHMPKEYANRMTQEAIKFKK